MKTLIAVLFFSLSLTAQEKVSFYSYDLIIQTNKEMSLSAWQAELTYDKQKVKLTGIEGGQEPFGEPADYDARGLTAGKIILASFTLKKSKAGKEFLVARIHVFGNRSSKIKVDLSIAADSQGKKVKATALIREVKKNE